MHRLRKGIKRGVRNMKRLFSPPQDEPSLGAEPTTPANHYEQPSGLGISTPLHPPLKFDEDSHSNVSRKIFSPEPISQPLASTLALAIAPLGLTGSVTSPKIESSENQYCGPSPNTTLDADHNENKVTWAGFELFRKVVDASAMFGPFKLVIDGFSECIDMYNRGAQNHEDYKLLGIELDNLFIQIAEYFDSPIPPAMTYVLDNLAKRIQKEIGHILRKRTQGGLARITKVMEDEEDMLKIYRRIQDLLRQVALNVNLNTWKIVDMMATEHRLKDLSPSLSAWYSSAQSIGLRRRECTPDTRVDVLDMLYKWAKTGNEKIFWLNGMAGTGKTTITYSFCKYLEAEYMLAASFFCSRQLPECRSVSLIIPTIAYQLAIMSHPFKCALSRAIEQHPDAHSRLLPEQFEKLLIKPLEEVAYTMPSGLVVVLDALDECEDKNSVSQMLDILLSHTPNFPLKFFFTSRPEPKIQSLMLIPEGENARLKIHLHELDRSIVKEDIKTYFRAELLHFRPSAAELETLVDRSGLWFIHAATTIRYISQRKFWLRGGGLPLALGTSKPSMISNYEEIDTLYTAILNEASQGLDMDEKRVFCDVLHTVVCAQEPLTVGAIASILGLELDTTVHPILQLLFAVLNWSNETGLVTILHESFPDFILAHDRSKDFYCKQEQRHTQITLQCLHIIETMQSQFNICDLESSYLLDKDIPDLEARVKNAVSNELFYACRYCLVHLMLAEVSAALLDALGDFLRMRLLIWMEVMNLKRSLPEVVSLLAGLLKWVQILNYDKEIQDLVQDAWRFAIGVNSSPVSESTPHIYVSALAFWPRQRAIWKQYSPRTQGFVETAGTAFQRREHTPLVECDAGSLVCCIAYSSDGTRIVSGCFDKIIQIWDAYTGQKIGEPLQGHTSAVHSVAYSPNGACIVSGSDDHTIRIWDAYTGQMIGKPLQGHTDAVRSVLYTANGARIISGSYDRTVRIWDAHSFQVIGTLSGHHDKVNSIACSFDGSRVASGSSDKTICIWDAHTGQLIGEPLQGHVDVVRSVAYSPDGSRIVSGSEDNTLCIWDSRTGKMIDNPLQGHTSQVLSVSYSLDGASIVSGSYDYTICIWNAHTGRMMGQPLQSHSGAVYSVGYSPDGARIVSGSYDCTICIWDAHSYQLINEPLPGHSSYVMAVAYSPDGAHIVSGSEDNTVRVWNAKTGQMIGDPLQGHSGLVNAVAYSSDGARIASGSEDNTIRIWDPYTGQMIGEPLQGHTDAVHSVAYSQDGGRIVSGSCDNTVRIWDAHAGQAIGEPFRGHSLTVNSVAYSFDGTRIVSGSFDDTIRVWDANTGETIGEPFQGHASAVYSVAYSPDGSCIVSGSDDCTILIWDAHTGQIIGEPLKGHIGPVLSVAYSPDGMRVVSGSDDKTIQIWDANTREMVGEPFRGHSGSLFSVAYSPDGSRVVSGSEDNTIRVWDADPTLTSGRLLTPSTDATHPAYSSGSSHSITASYKSPTAEPKSRLVPIPPNSNWQLNEDGWVVNSRSELLIWVPPELRDSLLCPRNVMMISERGWLNLSFEKASVGNLWRQLYS